MTDSTRYERYAAALRGEAMPLACVDLDAVDRNVDTILAPVRASGKTLRIASKSVRSVDLLRYIAARGGAAVRGVMAYCPAEASFLVTQGFDDIVVAYPTAQPEGARLIAEANNGSAVVSLAVDDVRQLEVAAAAALAAGTRVPVIVDVDVSYRPAGDRVHIGVRRSPLRTAVAVADLAEQVRRFPSLTFAGVLAYEAHIAGVGDANPFAPLMNGPKRVLRHLARAPVVELRRSIVTELARRGMAVPLFNGGGTGSVAWSSGDPSLTEVTAGSGFLDSHLFDYFSEIKLEAAAFFALEVSRRPGPGHVTCHGGGFIASGAAGADRLPVPYLPEGLRLLAMEGAGEVQTPLEVPAGVQLPLGAPVFFRHAKAGELAEHFQRYALLRGERIEGYAATYRGAGQCFN